MRFTHNITLFRGEILRGMYYMARRFKTATVLNLTGLTLAFAAFYMMATQIQFQSQYNLSIPDVERIFRVEGKMNSDAPWGANASRPYHELLMEMPEVESGIVMGWEGDWDYYLNDTPVSCPIQSISNTLVPFGMEMLDGKSTYEENESFVLIPASMARRFFGTEMAAGMALWNGKDSVTVTGVYRDFPDNCMLDNRLYFALGDFNRENWGEWSYGGYLKVHEGVDCEEFRTNFLARARDCMYKTFITSTYAEYNYDKMSETEKAEFDKELDKALEREFGENLNLRVVPLTETYFSGVSSKDRGNTMALWILRISAAIILLVTFINFLNFTLAQSPIRVRGINIRRVMGATRKILTLSLVAESVTWCLLAAALGLAIVACAATEPGTLWNGSLSPADHLPLAALTLGAAVLVGLAAGTYPAWYVTSFKPAMALQGTFGLTPKGRRLRTALVTVQIIASSLISLYIGILWLQSHFIYTSDYGFDKDEVCYAVLPTEIYGQKEAIRSELLGIGGVTDVAFSRFILGSQTTYMQWGRGDDDHVVTFTCMPCDWHYLRTMGISVIEGRDFEQHDGDVYIINKAARDNWSWVEMDKPLLAKDLPVIGVCENVRFASIHQNRNEDPLAFFTMGPAYSDWGDQLRIVNVRIGAGMDKRAVRASIQQKLQEMADGEKSEVSIDVRFLDQSLELLYQDEFRFFQQMLRFTLLCLALTLVGIFCLTMFESEYRRKEIGIRKLMGSTSGQILQLFLVRYLWLVVVSFIVAAPVAWAIGEYWLQNFVERTAIPLWLFPLTFAAITTIILTTVALQSWKAATMNPIETIKTE
ncbi:MAG: FtsX-like permease family protein [Bacteroidaceae bacterium]|nr:FtsX-like permease family protein [Bacteroidaceae bacterium]